jgi:hypothetical protein
LAGVVAAVVRSCGSSTLGCCALVRFMAGWLAGSGARPSASAFGVLCRGRGGVSLRVCETVSVVVGVELRGVWARGPFVGVVGRVGSRVRARVWPGRSAARRRKWPVALALHPDSRGRSRRAATSVVLFSCVHLMCSAPRLLLADWASPWIVTETGVDGCDGQNQNSLSRSRIAVGLLLRQVLRSDDFATSTLYTMFVAAD